MTGTTTDARTDDRILMYGADWCRDCVRSKAALDRAGVEYDYIDVEAIPDAASRAQAISGRTNIPVIVFPDGTHLVEPTEAQLLAKVA